MNQEPHESRSVVIERVLAHPPEKVWKALTEVRLLDEWLMKSDFQAIAGHKFNFRSQPQPYWDGIVHCEVLTVVPQELLSYRWESLGLQTIVTWTLTPTEHGTHLRMEQSGFGPEKKQAFEGAKGGWTRMLEALDRTLAQA